MRRVSLLSCALLLALMQGAAGQGYFYPPYTTVNHNNATAGYFFLAVLRPQTLFGGNVNMILDSAGNPVYFRVFTPGGEIRDFKLLSNGQMSYFQKDRFFLMDSTFTVVDTIMAGGGLRTSQAELAILPNGNRLLAAYEDVVLDLSSYHMFMGNGSPGSATAKVEAGVVQEMDSAGNVVFEWRAKDHYSVDDLDEFFLTDSVNVRWPLFNAVDYDSDGNLLISARFQNEVTKVNRQTGEIIWRLGGKRNQFTFVDDNAAPMFIGQHHPRRIANGHLTLFDNGREGLPIHSASAKEYQLDEINHTATLIWRYVENPNSVSKSLGSVQRLSNGSTVINWGTTPIENIAFNVIDAEGEKDFELRFTDRYTTYRVNNYQALPWQLHRPQVTCFDSAGQYYLDAGPGQSGYLWSTGDTGRVLPIATPGTYIAFVSQGDSGWVGSEPFMVSNPAAPCGISTVHDYQDTPATLTIASPVTDHLILHSSLLQQGVEEIEISDAMGRTVHTGRYPTDRGQITVPLPRLAAGVYFVRCGSTSGRFVKQ